MTELNKYEEGLCQGRPGLMPASPELAMAGRPLGRYIRGIEKRKIVDDRADRDNFVSRMGQIASETDTIIYAWALMTNHAHILLRRV